MSPNEKNLPTVGVIARRLRTAVHRVEYIIRARGIAPMGRAGNARVFDEENIQRIAAELGVEERQHEVVRRPDELGPAPDSSNAGELAIKGGKS